jgi:hypothetical protein
MIFKVASVMDSSLRFSCVMVLLSIRNKPSAAANRLTRLSTADEQKMPG